MDSSMSPLWSLSSLSKTHQIQLKVLSHVAAQAPCLQATVCLPIVSRQHTTWLPTRFPQRPCLFGNDPGRTRACNLWPRRPTPYPLGHKAHVSFAVIVFPPTPHTPHTRFGRVFCFLRVPDVCLSVWCRFLWSLRFC